MYEDIVSSIILDKTILNELVNENVTHPIRSKNYKTPVVKHFGGFFVLNQRCTIRCMLDVSNFFLF